MSYTIIKSRLILYNRGRILLLQQTKENGGNYTLIGGTVEEKEHAKKTLIRESREEAGIILKQENLKLAHVLHKHKNTGHRIVLYFKANKWEGNIQSLEPHKFVKTRWFPLNDLPKDLSPTVAHVLKEYRHGRIYSEFTKK